MIGSYYGRLFFGGSGAEATLGDAVNSQIVANIGTLSTIESIIAAQSDIDTFKYAGSAISTNIGAQSSLSDLEDIASEISFDYKGHISGFSSKGTGLTSSMAMTTGVSSTIDISASNAMSAINIEGDGRISAISALFDTLSTIETLTYAPSDIDSDDVGIMSTLR